MTIATLYRHEDNWQTALGAVSVADGTATLRGQNLLDPDTRLGWIDLLFFGITGRRFDEKQLLLIQGLWKISVSYPDPRIWNNRVAALAGSSRSTPGLAVAAAIAVTDATIYGQRPMVAAFDLLQRAIAKALEGESLSEFVASELQNHRGIPGFGRPIRSEDERIAPTLRLARRLDLASGPHLQMAENIAGVLKQYRMGMNIAAVNAALLADLGVTAEEYKRMAVLAFSAGFVHCEFDAAIHPEGALFPVRCERLHYEGPERRTW